MAELEAHAVASPELLGVVVPNDAVARFDALVVAEPAADSEASVVDDDEIIADRELDGLLDEDGEVRAEEEGEMVRNGDRDTLSETVADLETRSETDGEPETVGVELDEVESDEVGDTEELVEAEAAEETEGRGLFEELPLPTSDSDASGDMEADTVGVRDENREFDCVTDTVFVTPVGNVVSDAVPVRTGEDDDVPVILLVVRDDGDPDGECEDVFEDEADPVIVAVTRIVTDRTLVLVIVVDVVEVLLVEALPVIVGDDDGDRELRPDCVSVGDT